MFVAEKPSSAYGYKNDRAAKRQTASKGVGISVAREARAKSGQEQVAHVSRICCGNGSAMGMFETDGDYMTGPDLSSCHPRDYAAHFNWRDGDEDVPESVPDCDDYYEDVE